MTRATSTPALRPPGPEGGFAGLTLVVPTLNEAPNILAFLHAVERQAPGCTVLLADDDSKDDTRLLAERFEGQLRVQVLHRRTADAGLTASVADGILAVRTPYMVVMDADHQHPADHLPLLARALEGGDDVVIASRSDDASFSWRRRLLSRGARTLARHYLRRRAGLDVRDAMSGFFGVRTDLAQDIVRRCGARFERPGFKILVDLLLHAPPGLRVGEVPYSFRARHAGESKLTRRHYLSFLRQLGWPGRTLASFLAILLSGVLLRFAVVGASGIAINEGILFGAHDLAGLPLVGASLLAVETSILWNFAWNNAWTFRGRGGRSLAARFGRFHVASAAGMAINVAVVVLGAFLLPDVSYLLTNLAGIVLGSGLNFLLNLHWTWGVPAEEMPEPEEPA